MMVTARIDAPPCMARTVGETLRSAVRSLAGGSDSPRLDAELLLANILGMSRSQLIARGNEPVPHECERAFTALVQRRLRGSPVAYLTGTREFWSLALRVTPDVLVPRPETELLVELALQFIPTGLESSILDLGTGSGAIALAIASERPGARITAVDVSPQALAVAIRNSRDLGLPQIDWRVGSWFAPVRGERFDLIVANPPYVAVGDPALDTLAAEPLLALSAGIDGFDALSAIAAGAAAHLRDRGRLMLEHGSGQAPGVARLLQHRGFTQIRSHQDFSGKTRVTLGTVLSPHQEPT